VDIIAEPTAEACERLASVDLAAVSVILHVTC
jgi:hypothetical protein